MSDSALHCVLCRQSEDISTPWGEITFLRRSTKTGVGGGGGASSEASHTGRFRVSRAAGQGKQPAAAGAAGKAQTGAFGKGRRRLLQRIFRAFRSGTPPDEETATPAPLFGRRPGQDDSAPLPPPPRRPSQPPQKPQVQPKWREEWGAIRWGDHDPKAEHACYLDLQAAGLLDLYDPKTA